MSNLMARVTCPYCGTVNKVEVDTVGSFLPRVHLCELEVDGCDRYFVFRPIITVTAEVWTMDQVPERAAV